jgi:GntR family transcriptional regulator/MocR family aminotransferase
MTVQMIGFVPQSNEPLQTALRRAIMTAIGDGRLAPGQRLPPTRVLAQQLGIARNTVAAAYDDLVEAGVLASAARRGVFVGLRPTNVQTPEPQAPTDRLDWNSRLKLLPTRQRNIVKPADWQSYPYPFVYGQVDPTLFPLPDWRACSRDALGRAAVNWWAADHATTDDPLLIEQIRRHVLPRRGIYARADEILITLGSQHGLYLLAQLLIGPETVVGIEDPGYPDARNIVALTPGTMRLMPVDSGGLSIGPHLDGVNLVITTPTNQCPTMVTMPQDRRAALLEWARTADALIIEDDYESDISGDPKNLPALAAASADGRVLHLGTFSKVLAPGVRLGYLVGPAPVIEEARALRRLVHRSVPLNNQRTAALFIADGHYEGLIRRLSVTMAERRATASAGVARYLPDFEVSSAESGSSLWLKGPLDLTARTLAAEAQRRGVVIERGDLFFADANEGASFVRLGFSSIAIERIAPGLAILAEVASDLMTGRGHAE